jgi:streptomycin 6-kinase
MPRTARPGVVIRGWHDVLLASDDPVARLRAYVNRLAVATGVDDQAIWEWGFVERVSTKPIPPMEGP